MNRFRILLLNAIVVILLIICSCNQRNDYNTTIYADNQTNNNYLVYADSYSDTIIVSVKAYEKNFLIRKFPGYLPSYNFEILDKYNVYIYNIADSTYARFWDISLFKQDNVNVINGRAFIKTSYSVTKEKNKKIWEYVEIYTINDSLVKLMCKNTHLTDSVFKLKK